MRKNSRSESSQMAGSDLDNFFTECYTSKDSYPTASREKRRELKVDRTQSIKKKNP